MQGRFLNMKKKWWIELGFVMTLLIIPIIHFFVFWLGTNANSLLLAFRGKDGFTLQYFKMFFDELTLTNSSSLLVEGIKNSLTIFALSIVIVFPASIFFSYFMYKKILLHKYFRVVFFLPGIISAVVLVTLYMNILEGPISSIWQKLFNLDDKPLFFTSSQYAFKSVLTYLVWLGIASNMIIYGGAMARIPQEVVESAKIDGIGYFGELFKIVLPLMWPTLSVILLLAAVSLFNSDGPTLLMTQGKYGSTTLPYWIFDKTVGSEQNMNYGSAVGLVFTAISIPIMLISRFILNKMDKDVDY